MVAEFLSVTALTISQVFKRINDSVEYEDCVKELDAALLGLTLDPLFPKVITVFFFQQD